MMDTQNIAISDRILPKAQTGQILSLKTDYKENDEEIPFSDNFEYLEALEKEALLTLVLAAIRHGKKGWPEQNFTVERLNALLDIEDFNEEEMKEKLFQIRQINKAREAISVRSGVKLFFPVFCRENKLDECDKKIFLLLFIHATSDIFRKTFSLCAFKEDERGIIIRILLSILCLDYREELEGKKHFSRQAPLVAREIIFFRRDASRLSSHIVDEIVTISERHVKYVTGDNQIYNSTYDEITIETSSIPLEKVIIDQSVKKQIITYVNKYLHQREGVTSSKLDDFLEYGTALTLFFQGPSGTGKTMMARALAHHFNRPLITVKLINAYYKWDMELIMIQAFREAALIKGFIFFDEADDIFKEGSYLARSLLIQLEKAKCMVIFATNKAGHIDPAMERRLSMKVHFALPERDQRLNIWHALLPDFIQLAPDVDLEALNNRYPFSGGLIKNTIFLAANSAEPDSSSNIIITRQMLEQAADLQTQQMTENNQFYKSYRPVEKVVSLPLDKQQQATLKNIADAFQYAHNNSTGLNLMINVADITTGINAANALAAECGIKVKSFKYSDMDTTGKDNELVDKVSQDKIKLIDYAFIQTTEETHLLIIIDDSDAINWDDAGRTENNKNCSSKDNTISRLLDSLREYQGICCFVTHKNLSPNIPSEFHAHINLEYPPEEMQRQQWENQLSPDSVNDNDLVELVEQYPMHIAEIDSIIRRAVIQSIIEGKTRQPSLETVKTIIERYRGKNKTPVLFGKA